MEEQEYTAQVPDPKADMLAGVSGALFALVIPDIVDKLASLLLPVAFSAGVYGVRYLVARLDGSHPLAKLQRLEKENAELRARLKQSGE